MMLVGSFILLYFFHANTVELYFIDEETTWTLGKWNDLFIYVM